MMSDTPVSESYLRNYLGGVALLAVCYFMLTGGWAVFLGVIGWNVPGILLLACVGVVSVVVWNKRAEVSKVDLLMFYAPLLIWAMTFVLVKVVSWAVARGQPGWHGYGGDKGLANAVIEPGLAALGGSIYFAHWPLAARYGVRARRILCVLALTASALPAILVPPLAE